MSCQIKNQRQKAAKMHSTNLVLALALTMTTITTAAPLTNSTQTMHPLFTAVSPIPASRVTGVANATAGRFPHLAPDYEHTYNSNHSRKPDHADNSTTEIKEHIPEGKGSDGLSMSDSSPYPGINASSSQHPHADQAHNHTGYHCNHTSHHNFTATDGAYDEISKSKMLNTSADSSHYETGNRCAHPSHRNRTTSRQGKDKRSVVAELDETDCLGADRKDGKDVRAKMDKAGPGTGLGAEKSKRDARDQDMKIAYEDIAREMEISDARIAGGM